jgi:pimeloyl-ACP methyl ester carboxylesterase
MFMKEGTLSSYGYGVHYATWGDSGPRVLLIHSMGMDAHSMDLLAESLGETHRILSLTILDHGDSETPSHPIPVDEHAEIMRGCYRQLGFHPSVLIGHSIGGMMGMILAAEHPEELRGLVLVDIAPFDSTVRPARSAPPEFFGDEAEARAYLNERYPGFTPEYVENRLRYAFRRESGRLRLKPTGDVIRGGLAVDLWPYVERMRVPTLLLIGEESTLVSPEARMRMDGILPDLEAVVVRGAGHMIPQERPGEFEVLVRRFLDRVGS